MWRFRIDAVHEKPSRGFAEAKRQNKGCPSLCQLYLLIRIENRRQLVGLVSCKWESIDRGEVDIDRSVKGGPCLENNARNRSEQTVEGLSFC